VTRRESQSTDLFLNYVLLSLLVTSSDYSLELIRHSKHRAQTEHLSEYLSLSLHPPTCIHTCQSIYISIYLSCVGVNLELYKMLVDLEAFVHESIILLLPPSTCISQTFAMPLHCYCAIYDLPPRIPLCCAIHYTILIMTISSKGQG